MPVLSGFLPIPLAMMIPFMGAQSLVLGKQFGEGFQYGKRKISAMSNEEFNKITPAKLAQNNAEELKQMIPSMMQSITDMRSFQSFIVKELIATVKQLPSDVFQGVIGATGKSSGNLEQDIFKAVVTALQDLTSKGIQLNLGGLGNIIPNLGQQAFGDTGTGQPPPVTFEKSGTPPPTQTRTLQDIRDEYRTMSLKRLQELRNHFQSNKNSPEYQIAVQIIAEKTAQIRKKQPVISTVIQSNLGRTSKLLQDKLLKYLKIYNDAVKNIFHWQAEVTRRNKGSGENRASVPALKVVIQKLTKTKNLARDIFNVALNQSRNYKDLTPAWGRVQRLA